MGVPYKYSTDVAGRDTMPLMSYAPSVNDALATVMGRDKDLLKNTQANKRVGPASREGAAFVWSCTEWDENESESPKLVSLINPETMSWTLPVRVTKTNVFGGTVFHRWKNLQGNSTDLYQVRFKLNTGNIMLVGESARSVIENGYQTKKTKLGESFSQRFPLHTDTAKTEAFFRFMELFHTPAFTTKEKNPNLISLTFKTVLFSQATLYMIFTNPLTFQEDAKNPFNVSYDVEATVVEMFPRLSSPGELGKILD